MNLLKNDYNLQLKKQKKEENFLNSKNSELDFSFLKDFKFPLFEDFNLIEKNPENIRIQKRTEFINDILNVDFLSDDKNINKERKYLIPISIADIDQTKTPPNIKKNITNNKNEYSENDLYKLIKYVKNDKTQKNIIDIIEENFNNNNVLLKDTLKKNKNIYNNSFFLKKTKKEIYTTHKLLRKEYNKTLKKLKQTHFYKQIKKINPNCSTHPSFYRKYHNIIYEEDIQYLCNINFELILKSFIEFLGNFYNIKINYQKIDSQEYKIYLHELKKNIHIYFYKPLNIKGGAAGICSGKNVLIQTDNFQPQQSIEVINTLFHELGHAFENQIGYNKTLKYTLNLSNKHYDINRNEIPSLFFELFTLEPKILNKTNIPLNKINHFIELNHFLQLHRYLYTTMVSLVEIENIIRKNNRIKMKNNVFKLYFKYSFQTGIFFANNYNTQNLIYFYGEYIARKIHNKHKKNKIL